MRRRCRGALSPRRPRFRSMLLVSRTAAVKEMRRDAVKRRVCMEFTRGNTYGYEDSRGRFQTLSLITGADGSGKPRHRTRNKYDFIGPIIDAKVSAATSRTPSYDALPSNSSPESRAARSLRSRSLRTATTSGGTARPRRRSRLALGGGGVGYALPYFDPNVGPYTDVGGRMVGQGEVKIMTFTGNQVYSEPGVDFERQSVVCDRSRPPARRGQGTRRVHQGPRSAARS
jgi:hypothetical protein